MQNQTRRTLPSKPGPRHQATGEDQIVNFAHVGLSTETRSISARQSLRCPLRQYVVDGFHTVEYDPFIKSELASRN